MQSTSQWRLKMASFVLYTQKTLRFLAKFNYNRSTMEQETNYNKPAELTADRVAFWSILIIIFLSPLFFIPSSYVPFQFAKVILLYAGIAVAFCACIIARLKDGVIKTPVHYLYVSLAAIPVVVAIASFVSPV